MLRAAVLGLYALLLLALGLAVAVHGMALRGGWSWVVAFSGLAELLLLCAAWWRARTVRDGEAGALWADALALTLAAAAAIRWGGRP